LDRVRRIAHQLMNEHPERFSADFENNKKAVTELAIFRSKQLRNRVVGYITHYMKLQQEAEPEPAETETEAEAQAPAPAEPVSAESGSSN
jgi:small subunit ribosomal protein S17e